MNNQHKVIKHKYSNDNAMNIETLDKFLENEKINNSNEPWNKLDKTTKLRKLSTFADTYSQLNDLTNDEKTSLIAYFRDCLDKKKLQRVKDVDYDKNTGEIKNVPALIHNKSSNNFTLKNLEKRVSTIKGLTPKKKIKQGTIKNNAQEDDCDHNDNDNYNDA